MKLVYDVKDKPKFGHLIVLAFQQLLAILAATIVVPVIINGNAGLTDEFAMSQSAALFGAGVGTIVYLLFTKFRSPVAHSSVGNICFYKTERNRISSISAFICKSECFTVCGKPEKCSVLSFKCEFL